MITVYWHDEQETIIQLDYFHPIASWEEYRLAVDKSYRMAGKKSHTVGIVHNPNETPMPSGNALEQLRISVDTAPENVIAIISVVNNRLAKRIMQALIFILQGYDKYFILQSLTEAYALLEELLSDEASSAAS